MMRAFSSLSSSVSLSRRIRLTLKSLWMLVTSMITIPANRPKKATAVIGTSYRVITPSFKVTVSEPLSDCSTTAKPATNRMPIAGMILLNSVPPVRVGQSPFQQTSPLSSFPTLRGYNIQSALNHHRRRRPCFYASDLGFGLDTVPYAL